MHSFEEEEFYAAANDIGNSMSSARGVEVRVLCGFKLTTWKWSLDATFLKELQERPPADGGRVLIISAGTGLVTCLYHRIHQGTKRTQCVIVVYKVLVKCGPRHDERVTITFAAL